MGILSILTRSSLSLRLIFGAIVLIVSSPPSRAEDTADSGMSPLSVESESGRFETLSDDTGSDDPTLPTYKGGGIVRGPRDHKKIALEFTAAFYADGGKVVLDELRKRKIKASFFLAGNFYRTPEFKPLLARMIAEGHYVGPHSDRHLLYASWDDPPRLLVTKSEFKADLEDNLALLAKKGISRESARFFVPPFEHYTPEICDWARQEDMTLINYTTQGIRLPADYRADNDPEFATVDEMFGTVYKAEETDPHGLNGFFLLMHLGYGPNRTRELLYNRLGEFLDKLSSRGYSFVRVDELLAGVSPKAHP